MQHLDLGFVVTGFAGFRVIGIGRRFGFGRWIRWRIHTVCIGLPLFLRRILRFFIGRWAGRFALGGLPQVVQVEATLQITDATGEDAALDRQRQRQVSPLFARMIHLGVLAVTDQNQPRFLFDAQRIEPGLLLVQERAAAADGELLHCGEANRDAAGEEDNQQNRDQGDPGLAMDGRRRFSPAGAAGG